MRDTDEIQEEIRKLKAIKQEVPQKTAFGDDNHVAIDAQVAVLEDPILNGNKIYRRFEDNEHALENAWYAFDWRAGDDIDGLPSDGWADLAGVKQEDVIKLW